MTRAALLRGIGALGVAAVAAPFASDAANAGTADAGTADAGTADAGTADAGTANAGTRRAGSAGDTAGTGASAPGRRRLTYQGVTYDVGTLEIEGGDLSRLRWNRGLMLGEIAAIAGPLRANAVNVFGSLPDRLADTAAAALRRGLQVSIQPRLYDQPQADILDHLAATARDAERLRERHGQEVILILGCEHTLFTPGIVPGNGFFERLAYLGSGEIDLVGITQRLDDFLGRAVAVARQHFHGRITYASLPGLERVEWERFDIVGLDYYEYRERPDEHSATLAEYRRWNRPIAILEFGCATFTGAAEMGGLGWTIVDYEADPPAIKDGYVRDETEQADHLATMLRVFEREGLLSASPYTFIAPSMPHQAADPRHDYDTASFALCATIRDDPVDAASGYRWRPKQAFHAVANAYRR